MLHDWPSVVDAKTAMLNLPLLSGLAVSTVPLPSVINGCITPPAGCGKRSGLEREAMVNVVPPSVLVAAPRMLGLLSFRNDKKMVPSESSVACGSSKPTKAPAG